MLLVAVWSASQSLPGEAPGVEIRSTPASRERLEIALYHADLAVVRDRREIHLEQGIHDLVLEGVSAQLLPSSAQVAFPPGIPLKVLERNHENHLLDRHHLLQQSLDAAVMLNQGAEHPPLRGTLASMPSKAMMAPPRTPMEARIRPLRRLAAQGSRGVLHPYRRMLTLNDPDVVVRTPEGFVAAAAETVQLLACPTGLRPQPTWVQRIEADTSGSTVVDLTYLSTGLEWYVTYRANLATDGRSMDLAAQVTVTNQSGVDYPQATLQLVAGEPNRVIEETADTDPDRILDRTAVVEVCATAASFDEERLGDYHLFTLDRPTTLRNQQTKQIALFDLKDIPVHLMPTATLEALDQELNSRRDPSLRPEPPTSDWKDCPFEAQITVENHRRCHGGLGRALPTGTVWMTYQDPGGTLVQMPQTWVPGTPAGASVELNGGPMRGLHGRWRLRHQAGMSSSLEKSRIQLDLELRNDTRTPRTVRLKLPLPEDGRVVACPFPWARPHSTMACLETRLAAGARIQSTVTLALPRARWGVS